MAVDRKKLRRLAVAVLVATGLLQTEQPSEAASDLVPGHYSGLLRIKQLDACEIFRFTELNRPPGDSVTQAFLTVRADGATLVIEEEAGNTSASDYFETARGTLIVDGGHLAGGIRHQTPYYFDMTITRDAATGAYVASGTWIMQDACEARAPGYQATIDLSPDTPDAPSAAVSATGTAPPSDAPGANAPVADATPPAGQASCEMSARNFYNSIQVGTATEAPDMEFFPDECRDSGPVTFKSGDPEIASVDPTTGIAKGIKVGKAHVTASAMPPHGSEMKATGTLLVMNGPPCTQIDLVYPTIPPNTLQVVPAGTLGAGVAVLPQVTYEPPGCEHDPDGTLSFESRGTRLDDPQIREGSAVGLDPQTGALVAKAAGSALVHVRASDMSWSNGGEATITVLGPPCSDLGLSYSREIQVGAKGNADLAYAPPACAQPAEKPVYSSDDTGILAVDRGSGEATGVAPGRAVVAVTQGSGLRASASVTVLPPQCQGLEISIDPDRISVGAKARVLLNYSPSGCKPDQIISFSSRAPQVAVVSAGGRVTAGDQAGVATIVAVGDDVTDPLQAEADVTVMAAPIACKGLHISYDPPQVPINTRSAVPQVDYLPAGCTPPTSEAPSEYSMDFGNAAVDARSGVVTAGGTSEPVRVKLRRGGLSGTADIQITDSLLCTGMRLHTNPVTVEVDKSADVSLDFEPSGCTPPNQEADISVFGPRVARVFAFTSMIYVMGETAGTATIALRRGGLATTATTIVTARPSCTTLRLEFLPVHLRDTSPPPKVSYLPDNCVPPGRSLIFNSANPDIATVDAASGEATGVSVGATTISAVRGLLSASAVVRVPAPEPCSDITLSYTSPSVGIGASTAAPKLKYYTPSCIPPSGNPSFAIDAPEDASRASIDRATGVVTGVKAGRIRIRVTHGGIEATTLFLIDPR